MGLEEEKSLPNITDALQNKSINPLDLGGLIFLGVKSGKSHVIIEIEDLLAQGGIYVFTRSNSKGKRDED